MSLRIRLEPGETWKDVMAEETQKAIRYIGSIGCHPIPPAIARTLVLIAYEGRGDLGGHFVNAVLDNDLVGAFNRADRESEKALRNIIFWLYNEAPKGIYNDPEYPGIISKVEGKNE